MVMLIILINHVFQTINGIVLRFQVQSKYFDNYINDNNECLICETMNC
jgi:hypothetical protein